LKKGIEVDPSNLEAHLELAGMNVKQGNIKEGIAQYREVAETFWKKGDLSKSADIYKRITVLQPDNTDIHMALGVLYRELKQLEEAKGEFRFILRYDLTHIKALRELGLVCEEKGEVDSAILAFKKISDLNPSDTQAKEKLGDLYKLKGQTVQAIKEYYSAGEDYLEKGEKNKAIEMFETVLELDPKYVKATRMLKNIVTYTTMPDSAPVLHPPVTQEKEPLREEKTFDTSDMEEKETGKKKTGLISTVHNEEKFLPEMKKDVNGSVSIKEIRDEDHRAFPEFVTQEGVPPAAEEKKEEAKPEKDRAIDSENLLKDLRTLPGGEPAEGEEMLIEFVSDDGDKVKKDPEEQIPEDIQIDSSRLSLIKEYRKNMEDNPSNIENREKLAGILFECGLLKEAGEEYEKILTVNENSINAHFKIIEIYNLLGKKEDLRNRYLSLGDLYRRNNSYDAALDVYQKLITLDKDDLLARANLSDILFVLKEKDYAAPEEGKDAPQEKTDRELQDISVLNNLAEALVKNGLLKEALEEYEKILVLDRDNIDVYRRSIDIYNLMGDKNELRARYLNLGEVYKQRNSYDAALDVYQRLIALNNEDMDARKNMADLLFFLDKKKEAIYQYILLAGLYTSQGKANEVVDIYERMLEIDPWDLLTHTKLAEAYAVLNIKNKAIDEYLVIADLYLKKKLWNNAIETYEKIRSIDPEYLDARMKLSELYMKSGMSGKSISEILMIVDVYIAQDEPDCAMEMVQKVIGAEPEYVSAREKLVEIYLKKGLKDKAIAEYENLSEILLKKNHVEKTILVYEKLLELDPKRCSIYYKLAGLYEKNGKIDNATGKYILLAAIFAEEGEYDRAIEAYENVLRLDSNNIEARYEKARILFDEKKDITKSLEELEFIIRIDPGHSDTLSRLIRGYIKIGDIEKVISLSRDTGNKKLINQLVAEYKEIIDGNPKDSEARYTLGTVYKEAGDLENAVEQFQILLKSPEKLLDSYNMLALCFEQMGMSNLAINQYKKGLATGGYKDEEYQKLRYNLGLLYERKGMIKEALGVYEQIIAIDIKYRDVSRRIQDLEERLKV